MKRTFVMLVLALTALLAVGVQAQEPFDPATVPPYFFDQLNSSKAYAQNTIDTTSAKGLTAGNHYLGSGFRVAGMRFLTFTIIVADSAYWDVYFDHKADGANAAWAQVYADSLKTDAATTKEIALRNAALDRIGGLTGTIRVRKSIRNVTQGVTSATYSDKFNFKP